MAEEIPNAYRKAGSSRLAALISLGVVFVLILIWMVSSFRPSAELRLRFWSVSFSPDGASVVTGGGEHEAAPPTPGELVFWNIRRGRHRAIPQRASVRSVAWAPDGKFVAVADFSGVTKLVSPQTGKTLRSFSPPANQVNAVAVSRNGLVAAGTFEGTIELWDSNGKEQHLFVVPNDKILDVAFSPTDLALVATGRSGSAYLFDLAAPDEPTKLQAYNGPPKVDPTAECAAFSSDGLAVATGSLQTLRLWETQTGRLQRDISCTANVNNVAFSPDDETVATVHADGRLTLWNPRTGGK